MQRVPAAVLGLLVLLVGFFSAAVALTGEDALDGLVDRFYLFSIVVAVSAGALAHVVWRHDPGNRISLVALGVAAANSLSLVLDRYALLGVERDWPATGWALWVGQWVWVPALLAVPTLLTLRFPDGRLPSPRWRPLEVAVLGLLAVVTVAVALTPYGELDTEPRLDLAHPLAVDGTVPAFAAAMVGLGLATLGCLAAFVGRLRESSGVVRTQLQWGIAGVVGAVALVALSVTFDAPWLGLLGVVVLTAAIGVAVLRHGLFDVGRALNRSLVYGTLTIVILAVYALVVGLLGDALGDRVGAPLVATGLVAVGIEPLRRRVQLLANRVVYGQREDPYDALARVAEQLSGPAGLDGLTDAVTRALGARGAAIVLGDRTLAASGDAAEPWTEVRLPGADEQPGTLRVATQPGQQLTARDRRLLDHLGHQVAAAVRAARLRDEVEASRARLVVAREEERRRIRRELHDELGPTLAAIGLRVEEAGLDDLAVTVRRVVRDVRALVEGLRPAGLDDLGLEGAVRELARTLGRGPVSVEVATDGPVDDLPAAVSLAAYRIVGEAVTNVLRHAQASCCRVELTASPGLLHVAVTDDGVGLGDATRDGVGLGSMRSRAAELGGRFTIASNGTGTSVRAELPVVVA